MDRTTRFVFVLFASCLPLVAQGPPLVSPEVHPDRSVTVRFRAPNAREVLLKIEGKTIPMQKDDRGLWSATTPPLEPDYYGYQISADGVGLIDPSNPMMNPNILTTESNVHVPGPASLSWELNDGPHGVVHHHFYRSGVVGDQRDYYVYTPPAYNPSEKQTYPVLYLLHGFSDDASGWTAVGRAHVILDNLIAQGKARPMIIVMPLGYGAPEMLARGWDGFDQPDLRNRNSVRFSKTLMTEVVPQVEAAYRISDKREDHAVAGLSMGGLDSLLTGLNNLNYFAWIGSFSAAALPEGYAQDFPGLDAKVNQKLRLLWVACGTDDAFITNNRKFRGWLKDKGIHHTDIETPGEHSWMVWRRNLTEFSSLLFR